MSKIRRVIKNVMSLTTRIVLGSFVFYYSLMFVPALQAFWEESGIIDYALNSSGSKFHSERYAVIGDSIIRLEIVSTKRDRARGLSGRAYMPNDTGMWFIFDKDDYHGIWMKDMNFNIDIIWVDSFMKIVHIEENVSPNTYPKVFTPSRKARYVLELPAGYVISAGIKNSDQVDML